MKFYEYLDVLNLELEIRRYCNQDDRWFAQIKNCEVVQGGCLVGEYGSGKDALSAIQDYLNLIKGKRIAINATKDNRKEYDIPESLSLS